MIRRIKEKYDVYEDSGTKMKLTLLGQCQHHFPGCVYLTPQPARAEDDPSIKIHYEENSVITTDYEENSIITTDSESQTAVKLHCPRIRVLVMGRRNAGKTTLLEKMTRSSNNEFILRNEKGELVSSAPSTCSFRFTSVGQRPRQTLSRQTLSR